MKQLKYLLALSLFLAPIAYAPLVGSVSMQIDPQSIEQLRKNNPNDTVSRMLLARHYFERSQLSKAKIYVDEALAIDPNLSSAKQMLVQIEANNSNADLLGSLQLEPPYNQKKLDQAIINLHKAQKYQQQIEVYKLADVSNIALSDTPLIVTARYFIWDGQYENAEDALRQVKQKTSVDYLEESAKLCDLTQKYDCAIRSVNTLYKATRDQKYGLQLFKLYWKAGRYKEAEKLFYDLKQKNPKQKELEKFEQEMGQMREKRLADLEKAYREKPSLDTFLPLITGLSEAGKKDQAKVLIEEYLTANPGDPNVHMQLATRLTWMGYNERAITILEALIPSQDKNVYLRLGEIHAWSGNFDQAVAKLTPLTDDQDKKIAADATRTLAYTYLWSGYPDKAKHFFKKTLSIAPEDVVAKEELMILNKNIKPLLNKYLAKHRANGSDVDTIRRLASFYQILGNKAKAQTYLEKLNKLQPGNLTTQKELGEVLVSEKQHYRGFGLLEQYAYQKNTAKALFDLAQQYYWAGFNDEARDVLDDLLRQYPDDKKAYELKAEILKANPRFVSDKNSQSGWQKYESDKGQKQLELADRLYFAQFYQSSIPYYQAHLKIKPDDYDARYRYAFALQHAKQHREAAGEFYLMFWQKKDIELRYHYAYNLEMMGRHDEAKTEYLAVKTAQPKALPEFLNQFISAWESAWQSQNLEQYSDFYSRRLTKDPNWRIRKELSFKNSSFIAVAIKDPKIIEQKDNQFKVRFFQEFASNRVKDMGYKTLDILCQEQSCKITKERWTPGDYAPAKNSIFSFIDERLSGLEEKNKQPLIKSNQTETVNTASAQEPSKTTVLKPTAVIGLPSVETSLPINLATINDSNRLNPVDNQAVAKDPQVIALEQKIALLEAQLAAHNQNKQSIKEQQQLKQMQPLVNEIEKKRQMLQEYNALEKQSNTGEPLTNTSVYNNTSANGYNNNNSNANAYNQNQNNSTGSVTPYNQQSVQPKVNPPMQVPIQDLYANDPIGVPYQQHSQQPVNTPPPPQILVPIERVVIIGYDIYQQPIYSTQRTMQAVPNPAYQEYLTKMGYQNNNAVQSEQGYRQQSQYQSKTQQHQYPHNQYQQPQGYPQPRQFQQPQRSYPPIQQPIPYGQPSPQQQVQQPPTTMATPQQRRPVVQSRKNNLSAKNDLDARTEQKKKEPIEAMANFYRPHEITLDLVNYQDVNDVELNRQTLGYSYQLNDDIKLSASVFNFELNDADGKDKGNGAELAVSGKQFSVGARLERLENYNVSSLFGSYNTSFGEHSVGIKVDRTALPLTKYSVCSGQSDLHSTQLTLSDYTDWQDGSNFWGAIELGQINDDVENKTITPQFDYRFNYKTYGEVNTHLIASGWYQANSESNDCYYSPDFVDATLVGINADYPLNQSWLLKGKAAAGYSFSDDTALYQIGIWAEKELAESLGIELGCFSSNSLGDGAAVGAYGYRECSANLRYQF
jgi:tetratricopeptide (TPR) repeat protein